MSKVIMVGCDLHDRSMLIRFAVGQGEPQQASFSNDALGRGLLIERLREVAAKHNAQRIVLAYEASGQGYGLCDLLHDQGSELESMRRTTPPGSSCRFCRYSNDTTSANRAGTLRGPSGL